MTRADDLVPLKINARLGEVKSSETILATIFWTLSCVGFIDLVFIMSYCRYCLECSTLDPSAYLLFLDDMTKEVYNEKYDFICSFQASLDDAIGNAMT